VGQYAGNDVFPASFEEPNDATVRSAQSVNVGFEALADRTVYLRTRGYRTMARRADGTELSDYSHTFSSTSHTAAPAPEMAITVLDVLEGDVLLMWASFLAKITDPGFGFVAFWVDYSPIGGSQNVGSQRVEFNSHYSLAAAFQIQTVGFVGIATVSIRGRVNAAPTTIQLVGPVELTVVHLRGK
jgi:hypothetical protein